jgi:elongation factor P hydroxylase
MVSPRHGAPLIELDPDIAPDVQLAKRKIEEVIEEEVTDGVEKRPRKRRVTVTVEYLEDEEGNREVVERKEIKSEVIDLTLDDD